MTFTPYAETAPYEEGTAADEEAVENTPASFEDNEPDNDAESASASGASATKAAKPSRAVFRRTAAKALEVAAADSRIRSLAAAVLGGTEDPADLTATIMTAPRGAAASLDSIQKIIEQHAEDPIEAVFMAVELGKDIKPVWALAHTLDALKSPTPPAGHTKAARQFVSALGDLTDDQVLDLAAAAELIKRS